MQTTDVIQTLVFWVVTPYSFGVYQRIKPWSEGGMFLRNAVNQIWNYTVPEKILAWIYEYQTRMHP